MTDMPDAAWMARAGNDNELAGELVKNNVAAIGWQKMGDLSGAHTRAAVKERYTEAYPEASTYRRGANAGQLHRFANEIDEGDYVLTYLKSSRTYRVGRISGSYKYQPDTFEDYPHARPVDWIGTIARDDFSTRARNSLGSTLTVFSLDDYVTEIEALLSGDPEANEVVEEVEEESPPFSEEVKSQADELIADVVARLDPIDLEELVAGLLRAMGFQARTTESGADKGIDVIAHPDAFGFETPRIKVQVKQVSSSISSPEMRSFLGALRNGESGLYVSTGGFTKPAREAALSSPQSVRLLDRDAFIELMLQHYEDLESEFKSWIPLRQLWVPTSK